MMTRRWSGALIAIAIVSVGGPAFAELACPEASNSEEARTFAREHFGAAQEAYEAGRPLTALEHYQCSYRQVPHPDTLYNIGVLAEGIGRLEIARDAYEEYLERYPDSEARGDVQTRLQNVEGQIPDEPESPSQPQPPPTNPVMPLQPIQFQPQPQQLQSLQPVEQPQPYVGQPQPQPVQPQVVQPQPPIPRRRRTAGRIVAIITMPVGLVMTAIGGGLYGTAVSRNDVFQSDIEMGIVQRDWLEDNAASGHSLEVASWVVMGLGLATVTTSIVLFAVFPRFRTTETPESSDTSEGAEGAEGTEGTETPASSSSRSRGFAAIAAPFFFGEGGLGLSMTGRF